MTTDSKFLISSKDIGFNLVPKSYVLDRYPYFVDTYRFAGLWTWGSNSTGQLGDGTGGIGVKVSSPVQTIAYGATWKFVCSGNQHVAAIKTDGTLWLWGRNNYGQLGDNTTTNKSSPVQTVAFGTNWKSVSGGTHTAAIKTDGTLWLWGYNNVGQLGDNTITRKSSPVQTVAFGTNWKSVSGGQFHTGAIKTDGTLWLWGNNGHGQLGDNTTVAARSSPVQTVAFGTNWKSVSGAAFHTAAIKTDGTLWLWGRNDYGHLGDNTIISKSSPVQTVAFGTNWKSVYLCREHTAAIKTDGTLWLWGRNAYGQLGDGTGGLFADYRSSPVQTVAYGTNWKLVSCGNYHTAAIKTDGTLWLWGRNDYGQLGDTTTTRKSSPVQTVAFGTNWKSIAHGQYHTVAIKDNSSDGW